MQDEHGIVERGVVGVGTFDGVGAFDVDTIITACFGIVLVSAAYMMSEKLPKKRFFSSLLGSKKKSEQSHSSGKVSKLKCGKRKKKIHVNDVEQVRHRKLNRFHVSIR